MSTLLIYLFVFELYASQIIIVLEHIFLALFQTVDRKCGLSNKARKPQVPASLSSIPLIHLI